MTPVLKHPVLQKKAKPHVALQCGALISRLYIFVQHCTCEGDSNFGPILWPLCPGPKTTLCIPPVCQRLNFPALISHTLTRSTLDEAVNDELPILPTRWPRHFYVSQQKRFPKRVTDMHQRVRFVMQTMLINFEKSHQIPFNSGLFRQHTSIAVPD